MATGTLDARLVVPPARLGSVLRNELVERARRDPSQVVTVVAPAGYGKTTFLRQWAAAEDRGVAWVSLEPTDDDEVALLRCLVGAIGRAAPIRSDVLGGPGERWSGLQMAALTRLADGLWEGGRSMVLMLDDVHHLRSVGCIDTLTWLSEHLPPWTRLVMAGRAEAPVAVARLRARGRLLEVDASALAMTATEAREMLAQAGVSPDDASVARITERTEGWAAGIYLTALSLGVGGSESPAGDLPGMANRYVDQFLHAEILDRLPATVMDFLRGTAPLVRFDAAMCDHVLERQGSASVLADLERANMFLILVDDGGRVYRYHHLFRDALLQSLRTREPAREPVVLRRAAEWCAAHADPDAAIEYARLARDDALVMTLLERHAMRVYRSGRIATLDRWLGWFDAGQLAVTPRLAIVGAWAWALSGHTARAERWADSVLPRLADLAPVDRARYATLRSVMGRLTPEELLVESRVALDGLPDGDDWRATAFLGGGALHLMLGDTHQADALLLRAIDIGVDQGGIPAATTALGMRAHIAIGRGHWDLAHELVRRARSLITEHGHETYVTSALAIAVGARVAIHDGAVEVARADTQAVQRIRPMLTRALPSLAALVRLEVARAYLGLGELAGARLMLAEVDEIIATRPGVGPFAADVAALRARTGSVQAGQWGASTLTTAELRLLGYLPSHLTFREIADRLVVSLNTVKTQGVSIYGKLGVSSRSEAVEAAVASGLLDPSVLRFPVDAR